MKRVLKYLMCLLLIVCLCSCTKDKDNDYYTIELESNLTTGYSWEYIASEEGIVELVSEEYESYETEEEIVGSGGKTIFKFIGVKEGSVTLTFNYVRPWEENEVPVETKKYELNVDKNLLINQ